MRLCRAAPGCHREVGAHGLEIIVTATTLLRDFLVQPDRIHPAATANTGFLTLLPGESATVGVSCPEVLDPSAAAAPYALTWLDAVMAAGGAAR